MFMTVSLATYLLFFFGYDEASVFALDCLWIGHNVEPVRPLWSARGPGGASRPYCRLVYKHELAKGLSPSAVASKRCPNRNSALSV